MYGLCNSRVQPNNQQNQSQSFFCQLIDKSGVVIVQRPIARSHYAKQAASKPAEPTNGAR